MWLNGKIEVFNFLICAAGSISSLEVLSSLGNTGCSHTQAESRKVRSGSWLAQANDIAVHCAVIPLATIMTNNVSLH